MYLESENGQNVNVNVNVHSFYLFKRVACMVSVIDLTN